MRLLISTAMVAALALSLPACKQQQAADTNAPAASEAAASIDALAGTWKADLSSLKFEQKPDEYLLQNGTYECKTCTPPLTTPADGEFHAVADRPYYDSMSVKTVDDKTVEIHRKKGDREVGKLTSTVSDDGKTMTTKFVNNTTPDSPIEGTGTLTRVGAAPEGAHAISGQWMPDKIQDYSEGALDNSFAVDGDTVTWKGQGQSYTAQLGGPAVPVQGDTGGTTVKVARGADGSLVETYMRGGKEVGVGTVTPSADGQSFTYTYEDKMDGSKATWTANKEA